ncbi:efflux RND transporter permease subunit [Paracoccus sp. TK19116]|uniref:Efflux pump membrane transporter n=1 Tax=Paracoccus albicereus TaxID=2922394 RepID=A0ABT1MNT2_9RHOB|nr:efflux RND transporter permease subunit [Paracoccus albicereus]MCQ0969836.1 efflux RND transporter permease subunit [Paracoccus albicereus]
MGGFFVDRPVFAWVLSILTMLAGIASLTQLAVNQYPDIAPPTIRISASSPGATAEAVESSVTQVIEDGLTGIDGVVYMESSSRQGGASITLTFTADTDPVAAQDTVQSQVAQVERNLPDAVRQQGVSVTRSSSSILMVGALISTDGRYTTAQLGDILTQTVQGPVQRTAGVGGLNIFGSSYAMRIWLDPLSLVRFQLTPSDVLDAVRAQNTTVSVGSLGEQPTVTGQQFTATVTAQSQLTSTEDFRQILLKSDVDGGVVRLGDIARIEIGQEDYRGGSRLYGLPASGFGVNLADGANAVATSEAVRATLENLSGALPEGVEYRIAFDTTPFVELSIERVYHTLAEAAVLVIVVLLVFLQSFRATLIPIIAVPVVLLGTTAVLYAAGFSINTLTLFALVLSVGLLVDDAIVVVENVERLMEEEGLDPREATRQSMREITGALIGIVVVLSAVFLPMAFFPGAAGVIYRQFSLTIISAMVLSLGVAITLTPALCAQLLRRSDRQPIAPARAFNSGLSGLRRFYTASVGKLIRAPLMILLLLGAMTFAAWEVYQRLESSFLPTEDQGTLMARISLTDGSTSQQTLAAVEKVEAWLEENEADTVESAFVALGWGFGGGGQNAAMIFIKLKPFEERTAAERSAEAIAGRANDAFRNDRAGRIMFMQPPTVRRLGNSGGFSGYLVDYAGSGVDGLIDAADRLDQLAEADGRVEGVDTGNSEAEPSLRIDIDQQKAESLGISLSSVNSMLSTVFSGTQVNDFILAGSLRPVIVQAEADWRMQPEDISQWYARNASGEMVPFTAFVTTSWQPTAPRLSRYQGSPALSLSGSPAPGISSGQAMDAMEEMVAEIPGGFGVAWTEISYQERQSGAQAPILYALSMLIVFLALAALYESWSVPFSVMLSVPVGVLGAVVAAWLTGQQDDVYFKVGILTTIGLAARNAILIVEFAETLLESGLTLREATLKAVGQRLRPILMTTFTFMLGVLPMAIATGAGAAAQNAIGIAVLGGMAASTVIAIFLSPVLYVAVKRMTGLRLDQRLQPKVSAAGAPPAPAE